jgi:HTH-type transcriptional regulator/antitoxin HigA
MQFKILKTNKDYEQALNRLDEIFDAKPNTPKGNEFELLSLLIDKYEEEHHVIDLPHPIEAIKFRMEQMGLKRKDLVACFGDMSRVSDVLNLKRKLNLNYIRKLNKQLHIPLEALVSEYETNEVIA